jgi:hypothetical protein
VPAHRNTVRVAGDRESLDGDRRDCSANSVKHESHNRHLSFLSGTPSPRPAPPGAVVVVARRAATAQGP